MDTRIGTPATENDKELFILNAFYCFSKGFFTPKLEAENISESYRGKSRPVHFSQDILI